MAGNRTQCIFVRRRQDQRAHEQQQIAQQSEDEQRGRKSSHEQAGTREPCRLQSWQPATSQDGEQHHRKGSDHDGRACDAQRSRTKIGHQTPTDVGVQQGQNGYEIH